MDRNSGSPQSRLALGLRAWMWRQEDMASKVHITHIEPSSSTRVSIAMHAATVDQIQAWLDRHQAGHIVTQMLIELGAASEAKGCRDPHMQTVVLGRNDAGALVTAKVFYPLQADWKVIDGSFNLVDDWKMRFRHGLEWRRNSCSIDAALALVIRSNLGLVKEDQHGHGPITLNGAHWRRELRQPWGKTSKARRRAARDISRTLDPGSAFRQGFDLHRGFGGQAATFYEDVMRNAPQVTGHTTLCHRCCDNILVWEGGAEAVQVQSTITLPQAGRLGDIGVYLSAYFGWQRCASRDGRACTNGVACRRVWERRWIWLDRPAPTMPVVPCNCTVEEAAAWGAFDEVKWVYATRDSEWRVRYALNGFIWKAAVHYMARTRAPDGTLLHHDGLGNLGIAREVAGGWTDSGGAFVSVDAGAEMTMLQYEQQELATAL